MASQIPPPPKRDNDRFDDWMFRLWEMVKSGVGSSGAPLGVGVTPAAWSNAANDGVVQFGERGALSAIGGGISVTLGNNAYNDGSWRYLVAAAATLFNQNQNGDMFWYTAPSGNAGDAISFTERMRLTNLGVFSLTNAALAMRRVGVTFGASMTFDASDGNLFNTVAGTSALAYTINAPTNPTAGQVIVVRIANSSGGALGAATWNAVFKMTAWTNPANGFSRAITFEYNGTNWNEIGRTAADVPN